MLIQDVGTFWDGTFLAVFVMLPVVLPKTFQPNETVLAISTLFPGIKDDSYKILINQVNFGLTYKTFECAFCK